MDEAPLSWAWLDALRDAMHDPEAASPATGSCRGIADLPAEPGFRYYVRAARHRRERFAREAYPRLFDACVAAERRLLVARWLERPFGDAPDWTAQLGPLVDLVEELVDGGALRSPLLELARHDHTLASVARSNLLPARAAPDDPTAPNPTLEILVHRHDWPQWWARGAGAELPPAAPTPVTLAYFRPPGSTAARWQLLDPPALAALRVASEALPLEDAAVAAGLDVETVRGILGRYADLGMLVRGGSYRSPRRAISTRARTGR